jgi:hypothetical protein
MRSRLIAFSADPGGADCLIPVLRALPARFDLLLLAGRDALCAFRNAGFDPREVQEEDLSSILAETAAGVLTSASSLPDRDMTEKVFWRLAGDRDIPSVAVLDQWQCYVERFSGPHGQDRLAYMPTAIAVMDDHARDEMIGEGFPSERLFVTGQPALEWVRDQVVSLRAEGVKGQIPRVTFFSQPIRALFGNALGFDEHDVLRTVRGAVAMLGDGRVQLVCKIHPREFRDDFPPDCAGFEVVTDGRSGHRVLAESEIVLGMSSVMLVHSVLAGIPTLSVSPRSNDTRNRCHPVTTGVVPRLESPEELAFHMASLLDDPHFRGEALRGLAGFPSQEGATRAVLDLLARITS